MFGYFEASSYACGWLSDGSLSTVTAREMRRYSLHSEIPLRRLSGYKSWCFSTTWSPDGTRLAVDGGSTGIDIFDSASFDLNGQHQWVNPMRSRSMQFLKDSRTLILGSVDGRLRRLVINNPVDIKVLTQPAPEIYSLIVLRDESAVALMTAYHRELAQGLDVATALEVASEDIPDARLFAAYGADWSARA